MQSNQATFEFSDSNAPFRPEPPPKEDIKSSQLPATDPISPTAPAPITAKPTRPKKNSKDRVANWRNAKKNNGFARIGDIYVPVAVHQSLKKAAARKDISLIEYIANILRRSVARGGTEAQPLKSGKNIQHPS